LMPSATCSSPSHFRSGDDRLAAELDLDGAARPLGHDRREDNVRGVPRHRPMTLLTLYAKWGTSASSRADADWVSQCDGKRRAHVA
jgi:hypothetical protein